MTIISKIEIMCTVIINNLYVLYFNYFNDNRIILKLLNVKKMLNVFNNIVLRQQLEMNKLHNRVKHNKCKTFGTRYV